MILPPALRRWGPPRRQGLCSHLAHLWATSDSAPRSEPHTQLFGGARPPPPPPGELPSPAPLPEPPPLPPSPRGLRPTVTWGGSWRPEPRGRPPPPPPPCYSPPPISSPFKKLHFPLEGTFSDVAGGWVAKIPGRESPPLRITKQSPGSDTPVRSAWKAACTPAVIPSNEVSNAWKGIVRVVRIP